MRASIDMMRSQANQWSAATPADNETILLDAVGQVPIVVILNGDFPVDQVLELSDALLAAPVLVVAVALSTPDAVDAVAAVRHRHGSHLVVGVAGIAGRQDVAPVVQSEAQFAIVPEPLLTAFTPDLHGPFLLPAVQHVTGLAPLFATGHRLLLLDADRDSTPADLAPLLADRLERKLLIGGPQAHSRLVAFATSGASGIVVGQEAVPAHRWSATGLILLLRRLRETWEAAISA